MKKLKPGRPRLDPKHRRVTVCVRLHPERLKELDRFAKERKLTRSSMVERCIVWFAP